MCRLTSVALSPFEVVLLHQNCFFHPAVDWHAHAQDVRKSTPLLVERPARNCAAPSCVATIPTRSFAANDARTPREATRDRINPANTSMASTDTKRKPRRWRVGFNPRLPGPKRPRRWQSAFRHDQRPQVGPGALGSIAADGPVKWASIRLSPTHRRSLPSPIT